MPDRALFIMPSALRELTEELGLAVDDWSPATEKISKLMLTFSREVLEAGGEGDWLPLAPATIKRWGPHKPLHGRTLMLSRNVRRDWSPRNAVVMNVDPGAHFHEYGTQRYATPLYQQVVTFSGPTQSGQALGKRTRRTSRGSQRARSRETGTQHEPPRPHIFVDSLSLDRYEDILFERLVEVANS